MVPPDGTSEGKIAEGIRAEPAGARTQGPEKKDVGDFYIEDEE